MAEKVATAAKEKPTKLILTLVALVIMFLGGKIFPTWGPMTELGVAMLCAFIGLIMLITVTNDLIWPPCAALLAIIMWGYLDANTAIFNFIGTSVIVQMIVLLVICDALRETGAGEVLAKKLLSVKWIQGKPLLLSASLLIIFTIADIFLTSFGGVIFAYAVLDSIGDAAGYKKNDKYMQAMSVGLYLAGMMGASILPFGGMVLGITNAFNSAIAEAGFAFNPAIYIVCAFIVIMVFMILYALCLKLMGADLSKLQNMDVSKLDSLKDIPDKFNKVQIAYLIAFIVAVAYAFVLTFLPKGGTFVTWFSSISTCGWFFVVLVALCIIKVDGKPLMNCAKHFNHGLNWGFIVTVGAFSMLGGALSNNDLGFKTWLINIIGPIFSNMSWPVFCFLIVLICSIVTNFFSNMATGVIVSALTAPFAIAYAQNNGINITVIGSAIAFSSMFAYLTYAAAGPAPLLLGHEGIETKFMFSKGLIALVLYIIVATVLFALLGYIF